MRSRSQPTRRMRTQTCPPRTRAAPRSRPQNPLARRFDKIQRWSSRADIPPRFFLSQQGHSFCGRIRLRRGAVLDFVQPITGRGAARGVVRALSRRLRRGARRRSGAVTEAAARRRGLAGTKRETAARRRQQAKADGADAARRGRAAEASSGDCGVAQGGRRRVIRGARRGAAMISRVAMGPAWPSRDPGPRKAHPARTHRTFKPGG